MTCHFGALPRESLCIERTDLASGLSSESTTAVELGVSPRLDTNSVFRASDALDATREGHCAERVPRLSPRSVPQKDADRATRRSFTAWGGGHGQGRTERSRQGKDLWRQQGTRSHPSREAKGALAVRSFVSTNGN